MPWSQFFLFSIFSLKPVLSLSSFTLIKRLFSSYSLSAIRVVSSAYLRLLIFLPAILIPICDSSRPALCMMYSTYALNKQGNNRQPCHTPFSILNQSVVPCLVLTVASRSVSRFLRRQVRWSGTHISFKNFPQFVVIHTVKALYLMKQKYLFLWDSLAFSIIQQMLAVLFLVALLFVSSACISESSQFTYCWSLAWRICEHYLASMWNEYSCMVVWAFFSIAFLWD